MEIYIIKFYDNETKKENLFDKAFLHKKQAIKFVCQRLNIDEIEKNFKYQKEGMFYGGEFVSKNGTYTISTLDLII